MGKTDCKNTEQTKNACKWHLLPLCFCYMQLTTTQTMHV